MRRFLVLIIVLVITCSIFPTQKVISEAQSVQFSLYRDKNSFTVYVPGNQPVPLDGLQFQFVDAYHKVVQQAIQNYVGFLNLQFDALPAPMCLVLMRHNADAPLPNDCGQIGDPTHVVIQEVISGDVFWWDRIRSQVRPMDIFLGVSNVGSCPGDLPICTFPYSEAVVSPPSVKSKTMTFVVDSRQETNDPKLNAIKGQTITVKYLSGKWRAGALPTWPYHGPAGDPQTPSKKTFPITDAPIMALVAGVDDLFFVAIGRVRTFQVPTDGHLWLAANDDDYSDNDGTLTVQITMYDPVGR